MKQNKTNQNKTEQNRTNQTKTNQTKIKQNKPKQTSNTLAATNFNIANPLPFPRNPKLDTNNAFPYDIRTWYPGSKSPKNPIRKVQRFHRYQIHTVDISQSDQSYPNDLSKSSLSLSL